MVNSALKIFALAFFLLNLSILVTGLQFITGPCSSDADCASACCGFNSGKCADPVVAQEQDGGCGFGDPETNDNAPLVLTERTGAGANDSAPAAPENNTDAAPASNAPADAAARASVAANLALAGNGQGKQFITGACDSDADCASACCGFNSGLCAGPVVAQERDGGCGFGDAQPNDNAAKALTGE